MSKLDNEVMEYLEKIWRQEFPKQDVTLGQVAARATRMAMMEQKVDLANRILVLCSETKRLYWTAHKAVDLVFN